MSLSIGRWVDTGDKHVQAELGRIKHCQDLQTHSKQDLGRMPIREKTM